MARKKQQSFEEGLNRIEQIVEALEAAEISLEESIALYKEGMELSKYCELKLSEAEKQVMVLQKDIDGNFVTEPFEITEEA
jgi:exodeoxyribonuclease VII small subunit